LHPTPPFAPKAIRRAIQNTQASLRKLAARYGINPKTAAERRRRSSACDADMGPREPRSTVLSKEEEALIVAFRKHTAAARRLPLCLQAPFLHLTRSSCIVASGGMGSAVCVRRRATSRRRRRLTAEQWKRIRKHFPDEHIPMPIPTRHVLEAVLWILNTGAQWQMPPQSYPNYKTVHRRFQTWCCKRDFASGFDRRLPTSFATKARWMKKNASSMRRSSWPKVAGRKSEQRSAEKA
jgi:transposase